MDRLRRKDLKELIEKRDLSVSIFMPAHRMSTETRQDPIRLKNLLDGAEKRLKDLGLKPQEAEGFLDAGRRLVDTPFFWNYQSDGLALFLAPGFFVHYRLPWSFEELLVVARRFHVKPLLPLLARDGLFYILALSQKEVRVLQASRSSVRRVELSEMPRGMADALKYDVYQQSLQFHTGTPAPSPAGRRPAVFHGQGGGTDDAKENILRYFRLVDGGLQEMLREERSPLVLAGVAYLLPLYRRANTYPHLLEKGITGNPEDLPDEALHERAWKIVEPLFLESQRKDFSRYLDLSGTDLVSCEIRDILPGAHDGRVETLFVARGANLWGAFLAEKRGIVPAGGPEPGAEDLLDLAAVQTLIHGGTVHVVDPGLLAGKEPLGAVFRY